MIYGVTFKNGDESKHTYNSLNLLQVGPAYITPPEAQTRYISVPAMDGEIDATQALDGLVHYKPRTFTAKYKCIAPRSEWKNIYSQILGFIHGRELTAVFDDDPEYFIKGRFSVGNPEWGDGFFTIPITGTIDPYKYMTYDSLGEWLWDPFVFMEDYAWDYGEIEINGSTDVPIKASAMPVTPTFTCSAPMTLKVSGKTYSLPQGVSVAPSLVIKDEEYTFRFTGNGTVSIYFRGGAL